VVLNIENSTPAIFPLAWLHFAVSEVYGLCAGKARADHTTDFPLAVQSFAFFEWLHEFDPMASQAELRTVLGQMLFSGDDALKRTEALSGGDPARAPSG
jgi:ATPase subunit of ABC transporter with duplicated ATPase domains